MHSSLPAFLRGSFNGRGADMTTTAKCPFARTFPPALLALAAIAATAFAWRGLPSSGAGIAEAAPPAASAPALRAEGRFACLPGAEVAVGAEVGGRLIAVAVEEKAVVRRGDLLVEIESS